MDLPKIQVEWFKRESKQMGWIIDLAYFGSDVCPVFTDCAVDYWEGSIF